MHREPYALGKPGIVRDQLPHVRDNGNARITRPERCGFTHHRVQVRSACASEPADMGEAMHRRAGCRQLTLPPVIAEEEDSPAACKNVLKVSRRRSSGECDDNIQLKRIQRAEYIDEAPLSSKHLCRGVMRYK